MPISKTVGLPQLPWLLSAGPVHGITHPGAFVGKACGSPSGIGVQRMNVAPNGRDWVYT